MKPDGSESWKDQRMRKGLSLSKPPGFFFPWNRFLNQRNILYSITVGFKDE